MRRRCFSALAAAILFFWIPAQAQQAIVYEVFGAYLDSLRDQAGIPGLVAALVDTNDIVWERAYGWQDTGSIIATRTDTPFHADGLTQTFTSVMALRCAEERRLSLDDRLGDFPVDTVEPDATIRQLLTHTSGGPGSLTFAYRPERLDPLWRVLRTCTVDSYRESLANLFKQLAMIDSVPGANILTIVPPAEGVPFPEDVERYTAVLQRRATPYAVDDRRRPSQSTYPESAAVLTPASGVITTLRDLAKFDLALKQGILLERGTLEHAWSAPTTNGVPLPHATGWFSQIYNGEKVVWQFGMTQNASSSLMITLPNRGLTLILMANSDGLVRLYSPANGDITLSPFARLFLNVFVR
ncbi:MAG TPA: serine hydrolase domain-containing protein [Vicinamibacterales bacterium]|nr:serine hydrolase domain-containing protein [Vicinamibacterales bacterium]